MVKNNKSNAMVVNMSNYDSRLNHHTIIQTCLEREYTLMCTKCYKLHDMFRCSCSISTSLMSDTLEEGLMEEFFQEPYVKNTMTILPIKCCGNHEFCFIDSRIAPLISRLNQLGLYTKFSCEGHGIQGSDTSLPYISFCNDYSSVLDLDDEELSKYWDDYGDSIVSDTMTMYANLGNISVDDYVNNNLHIQVFMDYLDRDEESIKRRMKEFLGMEDEEEEERVNNLVHEMQDVLGVIKRTIPAPYEDRDMECVGELIPNMQVVRDKPIGHSSKDRRYPLEKI